MDDAPLDFCHAPLIFYLSLTCEKIVCEAETGACCNSVTGQCMDDVEQAECQKGSEVWSAGMACTEVTCVCKIPAVTEWGLVTMTLLVLGAGMVVMRRWKAAA
jgi:hypothetical protein